MQHRCIWLHEVVEAQPSPRSSTLAKVTVVGYGCDLSQDKSNSKIRALEMIIRNKKENTALLCEPLNDDSLYGSFINEVLL